MISCYLLLALSIGTWTTRFACRIIEFRSDSLKTFIFVLITSHFFCYVVHQYLVTLLLTKLSTRNPTEAKSSELRSKLTVHVTLTDQLGTIPSHPLPSRHICASYISRESLPRAAKRCRDHERLFWTGQSDGQMRSTSRQVHGLLSVVPRRRGAERCECLYRHYKNQEDDTVCGLVPDWIQGTINMNHCEFLGRCFEELVRKD